MSLKHFWNCFLNVRTQSQAAEKSHFSLLIMQVLSSPILNNLEDMIVSLEGTTELVDWLVCWMCTRLPHI